MVDVSSGNIDALKGMSDVGCRVRLWRRCGGEGGVSAAATKVSGQRGARSNWRTTGLTDFEGHFSEVFRGNGRTQLADLDEVAERLREVATKVEQLERAAREENQRRQVAREWAQQQADRNGVEKWIDDHITGSDDPPSVSLSDSGPSASVPQPARGARQTPSPGGGGGGGTSSARPSDLRSFAAGNRSADAELLGLAGQLQGQCGDFAAACRWATLDASGSISGLREWLRLNGEDSDWAITVAGAFQRAGSEAVVSALSNSTIEAALRAHHVAATRRDIEVDPPTGYGSPPTTGYSNDPVNTSTGNFTETEPDLTFPGIAAPLQLTRHYNSLDAAVGAFGRGWTSWAEVALRADADVARLRLPDGREIAFPRLGDGWDRAVGENLWLRQETDVDEPGFVVTSSSGLRWDLHLDGRLRRAGSGPGTSVTFDYDDQGRLAVMAHEFSRRVSLVWDDTAERVVGVAADDGRQVRYDYDGQGRLVAATGPGGRREYRWDDADLVVAVVDADGVVEAENTYDEHGRVTSQRSPFGRLTRFVYLPGGVTEVSDADGARSTTWIADGRGRLVGVVDAEGHRQSTSYDRHGNPVTVTSRDGSTVLSFYDDRGRRVRQVSGSGADVEWVHDEADRVSSITVTSSDAEGAEDEEGAEIVSVTRFRYEGGSRDPAEVLDPEGGTTVMVWRDGLLREVVDPEGVRVEFAYDERGDLVASTDAEGNVARLERDRVGRITAAVTPLGHRTTYRYDGAGPLRSRQDPDGGLWRYERTAAGRLAAVTDPTGGRTEIEYGEHGEQGRTVDALGRAVSLSYDDLGNRTRVELPDGAWWGFTHDAMSRLVETTDAAGGQWRLGYDVNGRLVHTVDPTGVERQVERNATGLPVRAGDRLSQTTADYDALGRTVTETGPDGSTTCYRYDRCGRVVEATDAAGGVTRVERDRAGRAVHVTHPMGSTYSYSYDACGRRSATIDTDGSRYGFGYDADGRLVGELWPTGEQAWLRYDAAGRVVERFEPGRGTSRSEYDAAGRLVRTSDAWHGRRRFRYDPAGQLVEAVDALGGVTRYSYDTAGRVVAVVDPLGGRTERSYDPMGRITAETDPLGRTTRYDYDAAGRQIRHRDAAGSVLSYAYDDTGRLRDTLADGQLLSSVERDFASRTMRVRRGAPPTSWAGIPSAGWCAGCGAGFASPGPTTRTASGSRSPACTVSRPAMSTTRPAGCRLSRRPDWAARSWTGTRSGGSRP